VKVATTFEEFEACEQRVGDNARAVLAAVRDLAAPATCREVTQRVKERGEWSSPGHPQLTNTPAQRGEPYDGIVYQHLRNFCRRGLIAECPPARAGAKRPKLYVAVAVPRQGRGTVPLVPEEPRMRRRAQEAIDLRNSGLEFKEIAERMGISRSYAHELVADPCGDKARKRKEATECETEGCHRPSRGERRCNGCKTLIDDLMPSCRVERWTRAIAREQRITINFLLVETGKQTEPFARVIEVETPRGKVERKLRKGDSWADGMGACGIDVELVR
jgi:hypothetical protein